MRSTHKFLKNCKNRTIFRFYSARKQLKIQANVYVHTSTVFFSTQRRKRVQNTHFQKSACILRFYICPECTIWLGIFISDEKKRKSFQLLAPHQHTSQEISAVTPG